MQPFSTGKKKVIEFLHSKKDFRADFRAVSFFGWDIGFLNLAVWRRFGAVRFFWGNKRAERWCRDGGARGERLARKKGKRKKRKNKKYP